MLKINTAQMIKTLLFLLLLISGTVYCQVTKDTLNTHKGELSFGARTTGSLFSSSGNYFGFGAGGQLRYRVDNRLNTEWFGDWMTTNIGGLGQRYDAHIGESMILYIGREVNRKNTLTPYAMGGFCGDYTKTSTNLYYDNVQKSYVRESKDRWSFATQLGLGTHYNITEKMDISFSCQYMIHFGSDIDSQIETNSQGEKYLQINKVNETALEGHLLLTLSANFVIVDLIRHK